ncbi:O-antigen ligase family protein [Pseudarthrobacter sp902506025]|uniref:O-antigen ligase family protein n=1 Tax=Pseudarthrobacter sp. 902506025 TaxID=3155291 RepID=UPI00344CA34D
MSLQEQAGLQAIRHRGPADAPLPAWPMYVLLAGFPVWWSLGAAPFAPLVVALLMATLMVVRRRLDLVPGVMPWFAFLFWAGGTAVNLPTAISVVGFVQRYGNLVAVGIFMLYYINARESLNPRKIINGVLFLWATVVVLGLIATQVPEFRLTTPVGALLPRALTSNPLVYDLVFPPMAEIQQPWGAPEPFERPAAPFPFSNSWGVAFVVMTPVAVASVGIVRSKWMRALVLLLLAASLIPALATGNRGMLIGTALAVVYVLLRMGARGHLLRVAVLGVGAGLAFFALVASGQLEQILGRQEYSDSTGGRLSIYTETLAATLESPLMGYGAPRLDETIGVSLGTQGYVWLLMFSYGFVGLGLFVIFLAGGIARTWRAPGNTGLWLHSVPVAAAGIASFYSFDVMQMAVVALVIAVLLRARYIGEELP